MGINRWSDVEERKRNETDAKAGDELPEGKKGDASSRLDASKGPAENERSARSSRSSRSGRTILDPSGRTDRLRLARLTADGSARCGPFVAFGGGG